jgi:predicted ferric reductase
LLVAASGALLLGTGSRTVTLLTTTEQPVLWWAGRASGLVAYLALWLAMVFGTLVSAKSTLLDKKLTMELHRQWALTAVLATVAHVVTLVVHDESGLTPAAALVPFAAERLTGAVALGVVAIWGLLLIAVSSLLQRHLPYAAWRGIHALAFGTMLLAFAHGVTAGTDTAQPLVRALYALTAAVLAGATAGRVTSAVLQARTARPARAPGARLPHR